MDSLELSVVVPGNELFGDVLMRVLLSPVRDADLVQARVHDDWPAPPTDVGAPDVMVIDLLGATDRWGDRVAARWIDVVASAGVQVVAVIRGPVPWHVDEILDRHSIEEIHDQKDARPVREGFTRTVLAPRGLVVLSRHEPAEA